MEIKSVNHRYFEFSSRTTRGYNFLDEKLKSYVQSKVSRGKVDVFVTIEALEDAAAEVKINHSLADGYVKALRELREDVYKRQVPRWGMFHMAKENVGGAFCDLGVHMCDYLDVYKRQVILHAESSLSAPSKTI